MLGLLISLSGMIEMVMEGETIQGELLPMYVRMFQELHRGLPLVAIDGVAMIPTVMVGQIKEINFHTNLPNGVI